MENVAIFLHDYSVLGGVQKVTCNLVNLFFLNKLPIKTVFSLRKEGTMEYAYPSEVNLEVIGNLGKDAYSKVALIVERDKLRNVIIQIENLKFSYKVAKMFSSLGCRIFPVLHNTPYYWIKTYADWYEYVYNPKLFLRAIKKVIYWRPLHIRLFKKLVSSYGIICVSKQAQIELSQILCDSNSAARVCYIYNPMLELQTSLNNELKHNYLVYVGRLSREKRPIKMLKMWHHICTRYPSWNFLIVGDGSYCYKMKKYVQRKNIERIHFLGQRDDVYEILLQSKISILLSYYEGLPTALLESALCKNALFTVKNAGGTSDIVTDGYNGLIVENARVKSLCSKLEILLSNSAICERMQENSYKSVEQFSNKNILNKWISVLER